MNGLLAGGVLPLALVTGLVATNLAFGRRSALRWLDHICVSLAIGIALVTPFLVAFGSAVLLTPLCRRI